MSGSIRLEGDVRLLIHKLQKLAELDKKGINKAIAEGLRTSTVERFNEEKDPEGIEWKITIRKDANKSAMILSDSGRLKSSIKSQADANTAVVGTNTIYAKSHQFGVKKRTIKARGKNNLTFRIGDHWVSAKAVKISIPKRPFLGLSEEDKKEIKSTIEEAISK